MRKLKKTLCLMMVFVLIFVFNASLVADTGGRALSDSVVIYDLETAFDYDEFSIELQAEQDLIVEYAWDSEPGFNHDFLLEPIQSDAIIEYAWDSEPGFNHDFLLESDAIIEYAWDSEPGFNHDFLLEPIQSDAIIEYAWDSEPGFNHDFLLEPIQSDAIIEYAWDSEPGFNHDFLLEPIQSDAIIEYAWDSEPGFNHDFLLESDAIIEYAWDSEPGFNHDFLLESGSLFEYDVDGEINPYDLGVDFLSPYSSISNTATLTLSRSTWSPTSGTSGVAVTVTSNRQWTVTSSNTSWLTVSNITPANRTGNGSFRINVTSNPNTTQRMGTITVTAPGAATRTISVTQAAAPATLTLSRSTWSPTSGSSGVAVTVTSNRQWTVTSSNTSWLTVSNITPANRTGNGSFRINVTSNPNTTQRMGTITVTAPGAATRTISVTQAAAPATLTLSRSTWSPTSGSSGVAVTVTSNRQWTVTSSNPTWLTVSDITPANRTGNGSFRINVIPNPNTTQRMGTITVTAPNAPTRTISVTQAALVPTLTLSRSTWSPTSGSSGVAVTVTSNRQWTVTSSNPTWLTVSDITPANRTGNGSFRINVIPNPNTTQRIGTITVTAPGAPTRTISVTQAALVPTLTLSRSTWSPTSGASGVSVTVTSNRQWTVTSSNPTWLTVSDIAPANRTGNGSFRISVIPNPNTTQRVGTITVTAPGAPTRTISVTQAALVPTLTLSRSAWSPTSGASGVSVTVTSNRQWTVTSSNPTWLTVSDITPANRTGNGSFRINVIPNPNTTQRVGTITVTAPGAPTRTISVTQAALVPTLTLSRNAWSPTSGASWVSVTVTSNRQWTVTSSNPTWLTVSDIAPANRTGNGSFRISVIPNPNTTQRIGTITVTAPGAPTRTISVTQAALVPTLTISPATNWTNIPSEGGSGSGVGGNRHRNVTVTTNATSFTVSAPSWINVVYLTGNTRGFRLAATHNTFTAPRTGTVTVTAGNQTRSFSVAQLPGPLSLRNGTGTFYMQAQGRNLFLQGSNVRTRDLPSQQWQVSFQTTANGNRYYRLSQGSQILAVTAENIHGHTVAMATPGSLSHANRGMWRFEYVGNYHYRIINRWTADNGWVAALTTATTNGGAVTLQTRGGANQLWYIRNRANFIHDLPGWHYPSRIDNRTTTMYLCRTTVQGSGWEQAIRDGILAWNVSSGNRNAGVSISLRTTGAQTPHRFEVQTRSMSSATAFGSMAVAQWGTGNIIEHSISRIYAARINDYVRDTSMSALNVARSVTAHEVGHILGLGDHPPQFTSSIMHGNRTRHTVTSHTTFDARNVRIMYGAQ